MTKSDPFADLPVIGAQPPAEAAAALREIGDEDAAAAIEATTLSGGARGFAPPATGWLFGNRAWEHTAHAFGFLPADQEAAAVEIQSARGMKGDRSLVNQRTKIALNYLRVADYPGRGVHRILFDFYARNQVDDRSEDLHFNATYRVREGERAPIVGYPIFVGLCVGGEGLALRCHTVNVRNDSDEAFLDFLEGDVFTSGLKLIRTAQPAIAPLSSLALGLTKSIARRNRNVSVQDFYLGLDIGGTTMGSRLALGDYIAVQVPETFLRIWRWEDWVYDRANGLIVARDDPGKLIPYNYVVFGVSRLEGD